MLKKIILYIILFFLTFLSISLFALPIIFDLTFTIFILYFFRKNFISIFILNCFLIILVLFINLTIGKNEKHGYFYRAHEKYTTKNKNYQKNISDEIYMPFGDIYVLDSGLNEKRELIKEPRLQRFITDSYGLRNDQNKIENAEIILVGDSFITGNSTSQEHIPSNILSKVSKKKVSALTYGGLDPSDYESIIKKYLNIIKKDAKIFVFYFEGNDFNKIPKKESFDKKYISWRGYKIPKISGTIRFAYERLERNKDKFLLKVLSDKNYFLRNIRAKSHLIYRKFFSKLHNTDSPVKYFKIKNQVVGFLHYENPKVQFKYSTYIFKNSEILNRINAIFFIPTKINIYSDYINDFEVINNNKFEYLKNSYSKLNIPVYNLTNTMRIAAEKYLNEEKYLYWRDDTHWNYNGIFESMSYVNDIAIK